MANIAEANHDRAHRLLNGDRAEIAEMAVGLLDNAYHEVRDELDVAQVRLNVTTLQLNRTEAAVVPVIQALVVSTTENDLLRRTIDGLRAQIGVLEPLVENFRAQLQESDVVWEVGNQLVIAARIQNEQLRADLTAVRQQLARLERSCPVRAMTRVANLTNGVKNFLHENRVKIAFGVLAVVFAATKSFS
jgi:hypothetical protein